MYRLTYWFIAVRMFTGCFQYSINIYMHLALHQNAHSLTEAGCCGSRQAVRIGGWTTTSAPGSHGTYHHQFPSIGCTAYSHSQRFNDVTWNRNHLLSPDALFCLPINLLEPIILLHMCNWFRRGKRFNRIKWNTIILSEVVSSRSNPMVDILIEMHRTRWDIMRYITINISSLGNGITCWKVSFSSMHWCLHAIFYRFGIERRGPG